MLRRVDLSGLVTRQNGILLAAVFLLATSLVVGCRARSSVRIGWRENSGLKHTTARYASFSGVERKSFRLEAGQTLAIDYDVEVEKGTMTLSWVDPDGETLWEETFEEGAADEVALSASQSGRHKLLIEGRNTGGSFDLSWRVRDAGS
jgi:hypothetical protein